jgi:RNA polymerase sigma factor (sigma-70 family)
MSASQPSEQTQLFLHSRLLSFDPTAPSDFIDDFLPSLLDALHGAFPDHMLSDPTIVDDCAIDTLLHFAERPQRFDPERGTLWTYLYVDAKGDILNALDRETRRRRRELSILPTVALEEQNRNEQQEKESFHLVFQDDSDYLPAGVSGISLEAEVNNILSDPKDLALIELIVAGVRETERYAEILGITELSPQEKRQHVKKVKDKLKKRLTRLGANLNER